MTFRIFAAVFVALVLLFPVSAHADPIGTVVEIEGTATIARSGGTPFGLKLNDTIQMGDVLATGAKSRLFVLLADNTEWTLAENSRFRVDEYLFDSDDNSGNKARYSVLEGGFRYVSGLVAKKDNPDVSINSPAGTIGIRGTDITAAPDADGGYDVYVDDGLIDVGSGGSFTRLQRGQGTTVSKRGAAPLSPKDWKQGRQERLRGALKLARGGEMRSRIQQLQPKQLEMRKVLREKIQQKRGQNLNLKENREQKQELRKEKAEKRKAMMEQRRSQAESRRDARLQKSNDADDAVDEKRQRRLKALQQRIQR